MDQQLDNTFPLIILSISISLIIILILLVSIFFIAFDQPQTHNITIVNNCSQNVFVRFGALLNDGTYAFLPDNLLNPKQTHQYAATPGTTLLIQGYHEGDIAPIASANPLTSVNLILAGNGFINQSQITDGNNIINNVNISGNSIDTYDVSIQNGYNIPISIQPNNSGCSGPHWNHTINATGPNACPTELIYPGNIGMPETPTVYQSCSTPCTAFGGTAYCCNEPGICTVSGECEAQWPIPSYFDVFSSACPNCLITNCDTPNYTCDTVSHGELTQYTITFCP